MPPVTRGPLPAGVYWRRRAVVVSVALLMALGVLRLVSGGDPAAPEGAVAPAAASPSADPAPAAAAASTGTKKKNKKKNKPTPTPTPTPTPLAVPSGPCSAEDVLITPTVPEPVAGRAVTVLLNLQTSVSEACTWQVSPETVTLKITSGPDDIWSSRECPQAIPTRSVVVRRAVATAVPVSWSSRRSDEYCTARTAWALPGYYYVAAAALGGEPTDVQFELVAPTAPVVTQTAEPEPAQGKKGKKGKKKNRPAN